MPDRGTLQVESLAPGVVDGTAPCALVFEQAHIVQVTFEVDRDSALTSIPADVSRPIPCYARIIAIESPGARLALLMVGGRYRMLPRNVLVQGIADGEIRSLASALGGPLSGGTLEIRRAGARLDVEIDGTQGPLVAVTLPELRPIESSMLRWDPWLTFAAGEDGPELLELTPQAAVSNAFLSKHATVDMHPDGAWHRLKSIMPISACYAEGTFTISAGNR